MSRRPSASRPDEPAQPPAVAVPLEAERWAHELLAELRGGWFLPPAWARFLWRSFARAHQRRRERRLAFRQTVALALAGGAAWAVAAAWDVGLALAGGALWLAVMLMLDWHLGMLERPDGRPIRGLGPANVLALLRLGAVPVLVALPARWLALAVAVAGVADVVDGRVARSRGEVTRLGQWLDPAVDTMVLCVSAFALAGQGVLPAWAAALVLARYALPVLVVTVFYFATASPPPRHGYVPGRYPGVVLLGGLVLAPFAQAPGAVLVTAGAAGGAVAFALTVLRSAGVSRPGGPARGARRVPSPARGRRAPT